MRYVFFLLIFFTSSLLRADVFLLGPGSGGTAPPDSVLNPLQLWTEPIFVNGVKSSLKVSMLRSSLIDSFKFLRSIYPNAKFAFNSESILFEVLDGKLRKRIYLVNCGKPPYPVMQFSMDIGDIPKTFKWPTSLPSAPDATPVQTMEFPERKSIYGKFTSTFPVKEVLSSINASLLADGWIALTRESIKAQAGTAKGEIYIKYNPTEIISISFQELDDGSSESCIYRKRIRD